MGEGYQHFAAHLELIEFDSLSVFLNALIFLSTYAAMADEYKHNL